MRLLRSALILALAASLALASSLALAGCSTAPDLTAPTADPSTLPLPSDAGGDMMGGGGSGDSGGMAASVIAVARDAAMTAPAFDAAAGAVTIDRVLAPADGWVVVRSAETPGGVLGTARVRAGANTKVSVPLTAIDGRTVRVALHVDRGAPGAFEFDPRRPDLALDKSVVVDGTPLESRATLTGWGVDAVPNSALLMVEEQKAASTLVVAYMIAPDRTWIEVRRIENGVPTRVLGQVERGAGEYHRVEVPIAGAAPGDQVMVTLLADRGVVGAYEPVGPGSPGGADGPWVDSGVAVSERIVLR